MPQNKNEIMKTKRLHRKKENTENVKEAFVNQILKNTTYSTEAVKIKQALPLISYNKAIFLS